MTARSYATGTTTPSWVVMVILLLIFITGGMWLAEDIRPVPSSSAPAELEVLYSHPSLAVQSGHALMTPVHMPDGLMPDFPQCDQLDIQRWCWRVSEATYQEGHVINVDLLGNGRVVANSQLLEMDTNYAQLQAMNGYSDTVWLSAIKVVRAARLNGLGKLMWLAGDKVLSYLGGCDGGGCVYHVFYNSSGSAAWMQSIRQAVAARNYYIVFENAEMFVYEIPVW